MQREFSDGKKFGGRNLARDNLAKKKQCGKKGSESWVKNQGKKVSEKIR